MPHLLVAISSHGYGHAAQIAPVLNALHAELPDLQLTLRTGVSPQFLESRIDGPFRLQAVADDFGMVQDNALEVNVEASCRAYCELDRQWEERVTDIAGDLQRAKPDLLLADIPYLTLAAARQADIPAVAFCCLNWADIYGHYCHGLPEADAVKARIIDTYNGAEVFLQTAPFMAMPELNNLQPIGPVAQPGRSRRAEIDRLLGIGQEVKLVLVAMGGITARLPMEQWPDFPGVRFIVQSDWQVQREDVVTLESLGMHFSDVLASCDVFFTKPGYGAVSEAAVNGVPMLYVPRDDWPEQPYLVDWLKQHGFCERVDRERIELGDFGDILKSLFDSGRPQAVAPTGVVEAIKVLRAYLT